MTLLDNPLPYPYFANHSKSQRMSQVSTDKLQLAAQFVNSTASHIFLTGKAGTGKTTFLHNLAKATHKNYVVVAPTGIAALNAKGVTIHSQFLLPFGSYLPESTRFETAPQGNFYGRKELTIRHSLNADRKKVLRNIDLLIIDEVSMLRADILDAIDFRLKSVKGNYKQSFGGVQLLMIGDLYQLPPIVKEHEWQYLKPFYASPHFFEAQALKEGGFTYIELDKIFRQSDSRFIGLLNALRDDRCTPEDLAALNEHYKEGYKAEKGVITLTTHNYQADQINRSELDLLEEPSHYYQAAVDGDFPENLYPLPESLELRVGAQVMFVKNDISGAKQFFNGKLAQVIELTETAICVSMEGNDEFWLDHHEWENKKYTVNDSTKELEENVTGTFAQFPIRLAWAITVHKSQGLTFDKAVIDVGQAFAPGQVYVALSRLRSLEGLVLRTRISDSVISSDAEVVKFSKNHHQDDVLPQKLKEQQVRYLHGLLGQTFDFEPILKQIEYTQGKAAAKMEFEDAEMQEALNNLRVAFENERGNTLKFRRQLESLLQENDEEKLRSRIAKGRDYYLGFLRARLRELLIHLGEVRQFTRTKTYANALEEIDQLISFSISEVHKVVRLCECILEGQEIAKNPEMERERKEEREALNIEVENYLKEHPKNFSNKTGRKKKKANVKGETFQITYGLINDGLTIEQVAEKRGLTAGTIEGHLAKGITAGEVKIDTFISKKEIAEMVIGFTGSDGLGDVFAKLDGKYSYGKLQMVRAHLGKKKSTSD